MILNELRVPGEFQIALRVRFAELDRSAADRAGVDITAIINNGAVALGTSLGAGLGTLNGVIDNGKALFFMLPKSDRDFTVNRR